ncbi:MAG: alkaline phosphatase D family protein [Pseudomonadales bacterium]|jgi:alkaline phosphatase D|nr:alkaline phosphatase D family protein [Pseudomonadales bacterium]
MLTRRHFLPAAGAFALTPAWVRGAAPGNPFSLGVASGAPRPDGGVLWTRLAPDPLRGGGMPAGTAAVRWRLCADPELRRTVQEGVFTTSDEIGHSVHVVLRGLEPGREYFYQFHVGEDDSPAGRLRTADPDATRTTLAVVSCQHYETGHWAGYQDLAAWAPDCVLHLGDYIYEGGASPLGRRVREVRGLEVVTDIVRQHQGEELRTLWDYRNRYAQYRMDPALQAAHAASPWLVAFDDHEVDNNWAGGVPQDPWAQTPAEFALRRQAAFRAYWEHMPLEHPPTATGLDAQLQLYGAYRLGPVQLHLLDTRQYRSDQVCADDFPGARSCAALEDADRTMTGAVQERWLDDALRRSGARWNALAQQTWFAPYRYDDDPDAPSLNMDQWDGYPVQRRRLAERLGQVRGGIVLSGDWHCAAAMRIHATPEDPRSARVATEFATTGMSSLCPWGPAVAAARPLNPHVPYVDTEGRGYLRCIATNTEWTSLYRVAVDALDPASEVRTDRELRVADL